MQNKFIDTHAHLDFKDYETNLDKVVQEIIDAGVEKIIVPGVTISDIDRVINIIEKYDIFYGAVGLHPSEAKSWEDGTYELFKEYTQHPKVIAIGEVGLDYYWDKSFVEQQQFVFKEQIRLAKETQLPLIVHDRDAHADTINILRETIAGELGVIMHCFSGSAEFAMECVKEGFYIALGGPVTFKNAKKPKEVAKSVPLDKLLLETDSPFLAPHPFRGKLNSPAKIPLIAEEIAKLRDITLEELAEATTDNAQRLFKLRISNVSR